MRNVQVITMDELCEKIGIQRLNWVKIDMEGGAYSVLRGGFKILKNPTRMIIEVPDKETFDVLANLEYSIRPLLSSKSKLGYYYAKRKSN